MIKINLNNKTEQISYFIYETTGTTGMSEDDVKAVADYAKAENAKVWFSASANGEKLADSVPANLENYFAIIAHLAQKTDGVALTVLKLRDKKNVETNLKLDTKTLLISKK